MASSPEDRTSSEERCSGRSADAEVTVVVGSHIVVAPPPLATPTRLGRYIVVEQVGAGGMGRVLRAYDTKLRREVALKLLTAGVEESAGAARIVREAQAMARLNHPNLVPVYDVEEDGDAIFIAMEYVEGDTLRTWLAQAKRSWHEVVAAFVGAGRGLAAAHAAGVVHRDFKPTNVMVGADGRVRVMDFGVARGVATSQAESTDDLESDVVALSSELTQAGTIIGTPPYMAPEQHSGAGVVPASDQYAYCVALYEALFGVRPFIGADLPALVRAKQGGVPETTSAAHRVPPWLQAAVVRGLAVEPSERWPTMDALLVTLERGRARARAQRVLAGIGAIGLASAGVAVAYQFDVRKRTAACEQAGASIGEVWNGDARRKLRDALVATGTSYGATTAAKVMPWLDAHAQAWQHARTEACLDEDLRELWDEATLDRSLWCLDERRLELEALVGELSRADATVVQTAVVAAAGLASVDTCRNVSLLERLPPPPTERRDDVRAARAKLSRAYALERAGKSAQGLELARSAREGAEALGWPTLSAAARACEASLLERQGSYEEAERVGAQAYFEAARVGAWDVAAGAASRLVSVVGDRLARYADGLAWSEHAEVALAHAGATEELWQAGRLGNLANVHYRAGEHAQARTLYERSLVIHERALGPDHPAVAASLDNLANVLSATGEYAQARELNERALAIFEKALGPDHPDLAVSLLGLANVYIASGDDDRAVHFLERAVTIYDQHDGIQEVEPEARFALAKALVATGGDRARARVLAEQARGGWRAADEGKAKELAEVETWLAAAEANGEASRAGHD